MLVTFEMIAGVVSARGVQAKVSAMMTVKKYWVTEKYIDDLIQRNEIFGLIELPLALASGQNLFEVRLEPNDVAQATTFFAASILQLKLEAIQKSFMAECLMAKDEIRIKHCFAGSEETRRVIRSMLERRHACAAGGGRV